MRIVAYLIVLLSGIGAAAVMHKHGGLKSPIAILPSLIVLNFIATLVHELGHAWMARQRGAQVMQIAVLPFQFDAVARHFGLASPRRDSEVGGYVLYVFEEIHESRRDSALIAGAGPVANFLLAAAVLLLAFAWPAPVDPFALSSAAPVEVVKTVPDDWAITRPAPQGLPDNATMSRVLADYDAYRTSEAWYLAGRGLAIALGILSLAAALANLLPFRGSDGYVLREALFGRQPRV